MGTYIENLTDNEEQYDIYTVDGFLDSIENEKLYRALCKADKLTLQIVLFKIQGYSTRDIAQALGVSEKSVYRRMDRLKEKMKKI